MEGKPLPLSLTMHAKSIVWNGVESPFTDRLLAVDTVAVTSADQSLKRFVHGLQLLIFLRGIKRIEEFRSHRTLECSAMLARTHRCLCFLAEQASAMCFEIDHIIHLSTLGQATRVTTHGLFVAWLNLVDKRSVIAAQVTPIRAQQSDP